MGSSLATAATLASSLGYGDAVSSTKKTEADHMVKMDQNELALRLIEAIAGNGMTRPSGLTPVELLMRLNAETVAAYQRAAAAAISYFLECAGPLDVIPSPKTPTDSGLMKINVRNGHK